MQHSNALTLALLLNAVEYGHAAETSPNGRRTEPDQYVEIKTEIKTRSKTGDYLLTTATCVVGSDAWFMSGNFVRHCEVDLWLLGTNVLEQRTILNSIYIQHAKHFLEREVLGKKPSPGSVITFDPNPGEYIRVYPSRKGEPPWIGMDGIVWLSFCSGTHLKHEDRLIPVPWASFGFSDYSVEAVCFEDDLGLPIRFKAFEPSGRLRCDYAVQQSTNFLGRNYPLKFQYRFYGKQGGSGKLVDGKVTSIQISQKRKVPDSILKALESRD